jgi:hypothetical protein
LFSYQVIIDVFFKKIKIKKIKKIKNIWTRGPKVQKQLRNQSDFRLLSHQICLRTKQMGGKKTSCLYK